MLDQWFEDLQQYESSLEAMASASLDPKYKEEVQHVDQWFRYLNEAERTATIYTLLEHSTQVQIRFFIVVLQQMSQKDPLSALLLHHPEKEPASATATMMAKAELEASQKLASVIPYQTGRPMSRPIDRHTDFLSPPRYPTVQQQGMFETSRPKSVIEGDLSSIFKNDWSSFALVPPAVTRPKSADISNWSFHKGESPWTPKLDQPQWTSSNRSSVILGEQSPPVVLSVYGDDKSVFPDYNNSTFHAPTHHYNGGQFLNPPTNDGYFSDHSDQSNKSHGSRNKFKSKDKKNLDLVDMQLLEGELYLVRSSVCTNQILRCSCLAQEFTTAQVQSDL